MVNLETLIAAGESRTLEFKEKVPSSSLRYLKTIAAFANGNGDNRIVGDKSAINSKIGDKSAIKFEIGDKSAINVSKKDPKTLILEYLQTHEQAASKEFCELLGLKASRTKDYLNELEDAGKIESIGANKNRRYKLAGR